MSTRKYRLAAPVDSDKTDVPYRSASSIAFPVPFWLAKSNNIETSTSKALLDDRRNVQETVPFIPPARWWLVLPCLVLITLATAADSLLMNDLIVRRYERHYGLDASPNSQQRVCRQSTTTSIPLLYWQFPPPNQDSTQGRPDYNIIQHEAASFHTKNSIVALIPALITSVILGSNCDIIGRRPLLVLPFVGKVVWYSLLLIIVSRDLSDGWLLGAHAIEAVFGSSGLVMLSAFSYITDCTSGSTRTRAFLLTEGTAFLARIVPVLAVGIWLRFYLYTTPLSVCLALSVVALLYALFVQPESVETV
jgi:hypothetical protein